MQIDRFLLQLHVCHGLGIAGKHVIFNFIQQQHHLPSIQDLMMILNLNGKQAAQLLAQINSTEVKQMLATTLKNANYVLITDKHYPEKLRQIYQPPLALFYQGNLSLLKRKILAIVGARQHSYYANQVLMSLLPPVLKSQIVTVSGLAQGVDSICHRLTLNFNGNIIGVVGTGLNVYYPRFNYKLQTYLSQNQLVISEYPHDQKPLAFHFPQRNRIIVGLCDSLLVVEAKKQSGSLITANLALQENRNVLAIPGRIDAPLSQGCNALIQEGAKPVLTSQDILEEFGENLTN